MPEPSLQVTQEPVETLERGRMLLLSVFVIEALLSIILLATSWPSGAGGIIVRLAIEIILMVAIYNGGEIIRTFWAFRSLISLIFFTYLFGVSHHPMTLLMAVYAAFSAYVVHFFSPPVSAFIAYQDRKNGSQK